MSACLHVLYSKLTQDLQIYLPNAPELMTPRNYADIRHTLAPEVGRKTFAAVALCKSIFKKFEDGHTHEADVAAQDLFIAMNDKCSGFRFDLWSLPEECVQVFTWAKTYLDNALHLNGASALDPFYWVKDCNFGPGASVAASGNSQYHKIGSGSLSMTDDLLYSIYIEGMRDNPTFLKAEQFRRQKFGRPRVVSGSVLGFVPKNSNISRTTCTEPSLNMFVQKGLGRALEHCLKRSFSLDLKVQQFRNKRLARIGSRNQEYATIDLSSASDTISLEICRYLLPSESFAWLEAARSPTTVLPDGSTTALHMMSSMGNGFTFPLQTMIFTALALGCYRVLGIAAEFPDDSRPANRDGNLGVFGDDIIIKKEAYGLLCRCLSHAGFIVNEGKSFSIGTFRESCGGDYFDGHQVRGVYCKSLRSTHDRYSLINRLFDWSANNGILLYNAISYLLGTVRVIPVPPYESDIAGIKMPWTAVEERQLVTDRKARPNHIAYKRLMAKSHSLPFDDEQICTSDGWRSKARRSRIIYNADAIVLLAASGYLRGGRLTLRQNVIRPYYNVGITLGWDYIDMEHCRLDGVGFAAWKQVVTTVIELYRLEACP